MIIKTQHFRVYIRDRYTIYGPLGKNAYAQAFVQKTGEKYHTFPQSLFLPLSLPLSFPPLTCHGIFLLFNIVLRKGKLKILAINMNFTFHLHIGQWQF